MSDILHLEEHQSTGQLPRKVWTVTLTLAVIALSGSYVISLAIYLTAVTIIANIDASVGPSTAYTWIASAYTVSYAVASVLFGSLADSFGRRWFSISAGVCVGLGSLIAALAQNVGTVIAGMAIMGIGGAGGIQCISAVSEIIPTKSRGPIVGIIEIPFVVFTIAGSYFAHRMAVDTGPGWRSVYWIGVASGFFFSILTLIFYKPLPPLATLEQTTAQILSDFDYLGFVGLTAAVTLILMGIIWEPAHGSTSPHFLAPLLIGFALLVATGVFETYYAKKPVLHPKLWRRFRTFSLQCIVIFVSGMLFYALQALYPQYMTYCFDGDNPIQVGRDGFPLGVSTAGGVTAGLVLPYLSRYIGTNWVLVLGMVECTVFIALLALVEPNGKPMAKGFASAATFGIGWTNLLSIPLIQLCSPDEWIGFATGLRTLMSLGGGSVSTSIYSTIFAGRSQAFVPQMVSEAATAAGLPKSSVAALLGVLTGTTPTVSPTSIPGVTPRILEISTLALRKAYLRAFKYVWYSSIPFGVIATAAAAWTKDLYPVMTMKVAQRLKDDKQQDAVSDDLEVDSQSELPTIKPDAAKVDME
ncbi:uncharacterized protein Z518_00122 [Rhinocladiella mackenziei CBS 650.93]|uniref:Major facilitator superfamily (MFS) profile domain-containing protein n=1 Tax=Rhinocladiella mackenziei CBS 650.93 TaxID=1442369 RepID=A0A0D2ISV0_9EURO|nr:uncharacterized protein Z518_00122 [Rhinocladiella mackenziei CBS 650.93]KIX09044.1 hypothetical protein Z518_00122 [Rhinocladiella mackenziei CBS 650.93]